MSLKNGLELESKEDLTGYVFLDYWLDCPLEMTSSFLGDLSWFAVTLFVQLLAFFFCLRAVWKLKTKMIININRLFRHLYAANR